MYIQLHTTIRSVILFQFSFRFQRNSSTLRNRVDASNRKTKIAFNLNQLHPQSFLYRQVSDASLERSQSQSNTPRIDYLPIPFPFRITGFQKPLSVESETFYRVAVDNTFLGFGNPPSFLIHTIFKSGLSYTFPIFLFISLYISSLFTAGVLVQ